MRTTRCPRGPRGLRAQRAFTLVELVVVMALMSVIAAVGLSRLASREPFAVQAAADQLVAGLRLAQATAVAQRRTVFVALGSSPVTLQVCLDAACTQPLRNAAGDLQWLATNAGVDLAAAAAFSFSAAGVPSLATSLSLQLASAGGAHSAPAVVVEAVSGHVHSP